MAFVDAVEAIPREVPNAAGRAHERPAGFRTGGKTLDLPFPSMRFVSPPVYRSAIPAGSSRKARAADREHLDAALHAFAAFARSTRSLEFPTPSRPREKGIHRCGGAYRPQHRRSRLELRFSSRRHADKRGSRLEEFAASDFARAPRFLYRPLSSRSKPQRRRVLDSLRITSKTRCSIQLYREKQQEVDLQLTMLSARETKKFIESRPCTVRSGRRTFCAPAEEILARTRKIAAHRKHPPKRRADSRFRRNAAAR